MNATLLDLKSILTEKLDALVNYSFDIFDAVAYMKQENEQFHNELSMFLNGVATPTANAWKVLGI